MSLGIILRKGWVCRHTFPLIESGTRLERLVAFVAVCTQPVNACVPRVCRSDPDPTVTSEATGKSGARAAGPVRLLWLVRMLLFPTRSQITASSKKQRLGRRLTENVDSIGRFGFETGLRDHHRITGKPRSAHGRDISEHSPTPRGAQFNSFNVYRYIALCSYVFPILSHPRIRSWPHGQSCMHAHLLFKCGSRSPHSSLAAPFIPCK